MNIPSFTAEASIYKTSGHYQTGRQAVNLPIETISSIYPARDEVIEVHSCAPGWTDIGGTCWPNPLTEPSSGGSGDPGTPSPFENGGGGGGGGGSGSGSGGPRRPPKQMKCECSPGCAQKSGDPCKLVIDESQTGYSYAWCEGSCYNSEGNPCGGCVMEPA
jgi:hypothetical protein